MTTTSAPLTMLQARKIYRDEPAFWRILDVIAQWMEDSPGLSVRDVAAAAELAADIVEEERRQRNEHHDRR